MRRSLLTLPAVLAVSLLMTTGPVSAQEEPAAAAQSRLGRFVTLSSPINDRAIARLKNTALEILAESADAPAGQPAPVLVVQVPSGSSQFHSVYGLASFLASAEVAPLRTVAWVPETVTGANAVVALACDEIAMHPDAELGDLGRGQAMPEDQSQVVLAVVKKRLNAKLTPGLAEGLMDPAASVVLATVEPADGQTERRVVTRKELKQLRDDGVQVRDVRTLIEAGAPGRLSGAAARRNDVLVTRTATNRGELADVLGLEPEAMREKAADDRPQVVRRIRLDGEIGVVQESFLKRAIDRAVAQKATTIIFDIDSPGGLLWASRDLAFKIADLESRDVRTIAWVEQNAISGAAIIALGCDEIHMRPTATIGDAAPIEMREGMAFERAPEKVLSLELEALETLCKKKNRPAAIAKAMADKDLEVFKVTHRETGRVWYMSDREIQDSAGEWIKGPPIREADNQNLLTINGERANELRIAERPSEDFEELLGRLGLPPGDEIQTMGRTWVDDLVFWLNTPAVTVLLFFVGMVLIYLELHFMTGLMAIGALLCFALFFWARMLGGTAGSLELVMFVLAIGLIAMEVFVVPGFGVFGVTGGLLLIASLVMASQTFQGLTTSQSLEESAKTLGQLAAAVAGVVVVGAVISRYLPSIPILREMVLAPPGAAEAEGVRLRPELTSSASPAGIGLGAVGTAETTLRPAGKAMIDGQYLDVVSEGGMIDAGVPIEVVHVAGNRIVVRATGLA